MGPFWYGFFGGLAVNVVRLAELANTPPEERPKTFSDPFYVFQLIALPLLGGGLAYTYEADGIVLKPILALNIGASAPLILKNLASALPPIGPRKIN
jgi:hypothetical protein